MNYTKITQAEYTLLTLDTINQIAQCVMYLVVSFILLSVSCIMHKCYRVFFILKPSLYAKYSNKSLIYTFFILIMLFSFFKMIGNLASFIRMLIKVITIYTSPLFLSSSLVFFSPAVIASIRAFFISEVVLEVISQIIFLLVFVAMLWLWFNAIDGLNVIMHRIVFVFRFLTIFCVIFITIFSTPCILIRHVPGNLLLDSYSIAHYYILIGVVVFFTLVLDACIIILCFVVVWNSIFLQIRFRETYKHSPHLLENINRFRWVTGFLTLVTFSYLITCNLFTLSYSLQLLQIQYFILALVFHDLPCLFTFMLSVLIVGPLDYFCLSDKAYFSSKSNPLFRDGTETDSEIDLDESGKSLG